MGEPVQAKPSRLRYYALAAFAAGTIGLGVGVAYAKQIGHAIDVVSCKYFKADEKGRDYLPDSVVDAWDSLAEFHHGKDRNELKDMRQKVVKDLEHKIDQYQTSPTE